MSKSVSNIGKKIEMQFSIIRKNVTENKISFLKGSAFLLFVNFFRLQLIKITWNIIISVYYSNFFYAYQKVVGEIK